MKWPMGRLPWPHGWGRLTGVRPIILEQVSLRFYAVTGGAGGLSVGES